MPILMSGRSEHDHTPVETRQLERPRTALRLTALISVLALASLSFSACSDDDDDPTPPANTGTVSGTVMASGVGVENAEVEIVGSVTRTATTNSSGAYQLAAVPVGDYTVTVTLPEGFTLAAGQSESQMVTVSNGQTSTVSWLAEGDATTRVVILNANSFVPDELTIPAGTTVRWEVDVGSHTVTPDDDSQSGAWDGTGTLNPDDTFEFTFAQAGQAYDYHCVFHRATGMTGRIVVE